MRQHIEKQETYQAQKLFRSSPMLFIRHFIFFLKASSHLKLKKTPAKLSKFSPQENILLYHPKNLLSLQFYPLPLKISLTAPSPDTSHSCLSPLPSISLKNGSQNLYSAAGPLPVTEFAPLCKSSSRCHPLIALQKAISDFIATN